MLAMLLCRLLLLLATATLRLLLCRLLLLLLRQRVDSLIASAPQLALLGLQLGQLRGQVHAVQLRVAPPLLERQHAVLHGGHQLAQPTQQCIGMALQRQSAAWRQLLLSGLAVQLRRLGCKRRGEGAQRSWAVSAA